MLQCAAQYCSRKKAIAVDGDDFFCVMLSFLCSSTILHLLALFLTPFRCICHRVESYCYCCNENASYIHEHHVCGRPPHSPCNI